MAYSVKSKKTGTEYFLHSGQAANGTTPFFYFAKVAKEGAALDKLPEGYEVSENSVTGLPILKKKKQ